MKGEKEIQEKGKIEERERKKEKRERKKEIATEKEEREWRVKNQDGKKRERNSGDKDK